MCFQNASVFKGFFTVFAVVRSFNYLASTYLLDMFNRVLLPFLRVGEFTGTESARMERVIMRSYMSKKVSTRGDNPTTNIAGVFFCYPMIAFGMPLQINKRAVGLLTFIAREGIFLRMLLGVPL